MAHQTGITIKSNRELKLMLEAGQIIARAKAKLTAAIVPGVATRDLDAIADQVLNREIGDTLAGAVAGAGP